MNESSADSMTLAIAHREGDRAIVDGIRERRPPFSPESVVAEFAGLLVSYRVTTVRGDRYGGEWPREAFRKCGVEYQVSHRDRSALYVELLPLLNGGRADLLDHAGLVAQLCQLERRTGRGRDVVDHPPGGHDDIVNATAGALTSVMGAPAFQVVQPVVIHPDGTVTGMPSLGQPLSGAEARAASERHAAETMAAAHREASGFGMYGIRGPAGDRAERI
jgi:hypothetical protein